MSARSVELILRQADQAAHVRRDQDHDVEGVVEPAFSHFVEQLPDRHSDRRQAFLGGLVMAERLQIRREERPQTVAQPTGVGEEGPQLAQLSAV